MNKGILYLIPCPIGDVDPKSCLPLENFEIIQNTFFYLAENEKHCRGFLKKCDIKVPLQEIDVRSLNNHTDPMEYSSMLDPIFEGKNVGIISEAGCPGIADPGAEIVKIAHEKKIQVVPLVGPSSILLAIMSSGFSGQQFSFIGYLPKEQKDRVRKIKEIESLAARGITQIFMDTPYRNKHVFDDLVKNLNPNSKLCIAKELNTPEEKISTRTVADWKKSAISIDKKNCLFLLGS